MYQCPSGYCCQNETCSEIMTCASHRKGMLCGQCEDHYSESLFSPSCIPNDQCTHATSFWAVIAAYGFLYVLFFLFEEEIKIIVRSFSVWIAEKIQSCRQYCNIKGDNIKTELDQLANYASVLGASIKKQRHTTDATVEHAADAKQKSQDDKEKEGATLQIFMYFVQVPDLLAIDILYVGNRDKPLDYLMDQIKNIVSFNTFGLHLNTCLFKDMTAIFKTWVQLAFIVYLFVIWIFIFVATMPFASRCRNAKCLSKWPADITMKARFLSALVNLLLYTYQYFAENSFIMLKCVHIKGQEKSLLFLDGNEECYQGWQYGILVFVCIYVFPFSLVLAYAPSLLHRRIISVKVFMMSILFPLFSSPLLMFIFYRDKGLVYKIKKPLKGTQTSDNHPKRLPRKEWLGGVGNALQYSAFKQERRTGGRSVEAIVGVIFDPYRDDLAGGLCWEGMIALRRLILVIVATLVSNVLIRHLLLVVICLSALLFHIKTRPFVKQSSNILENCSLVVMTIVAVVNLLKASYFDSGTFPRGTADIVLQIYDWIEAVFLGFIPIAIVGFGVLAITIRACAFIGSCSKSNKNEHKSKVHFKDVTPWYQQINSAPLHQSKLTPIGKGHISNAPLHHSNLAPAGNWHISNTPLHHSKLIHVGKGHNRNVPLYHSKLTTAGKGNNSNVPLYHSKLTTAGKGNNSNAPLYHSKLTTAGKGHNSNALLHYSKLAPVGKSQFGKALLSHTNLATVGQGQTSKALLPRTNFATVGQGQSSKPMLLRTNLATVGQGQTSKASLPRANLATAGQGQSSKPMLLRTHLATVGQRQTSKASLPRTNLATAGQGQRSKPMLLRTNLATVGHGQTSKASLPRTNLATVGQRQSSKASLPRTNLATVGQEHNNTMLPHKNLATVEQGNSNVQLLRTNFAITGQGPSCNLPHKILSTSVQGQSNTHLPHTNVCTVVQDHSKTYLPPTNLSTLGQDHSKTHLPRTNLSTLMQEHSKTHLPRTNLSTLGQDHSNTHLPYKNLSTSVQGLSNTRDVNLLIPGNTHQPHSNISTAEQDHSNTLLPCTNLSTSVQRQSNTLQPYTNISTAEQDYSNKHLPRTNLSIV